MLSTGVGTASGSIHATSKKAKCDYVPVSSSDVSVPVTEIRLMSELTLRFDYAHCDVYIDQIDCSVLFIKPLKELPKESKILFADLPVDKPPCNGNYASDKLLLHQDFRCYSPPNLLRNPVLNKQLNC